MSNNVSVWSLFSQKDKTFSKCYCSKNQPIFILIDLVAFLVSVSFRMERFKFASLFIFFLFLCLSLFLFSISLINLICPCRQCSTCSCITYRLDVSHLFLTRLQVWRHLFRWFCHVWSFIHDRIILHSTQLVNLVPLE